ncbi:PolC-type DNA polymerase III [Calorimonas adulescens]|uniref:DNA polymerase III PolC-type n=1 Tax=Calorimonas adulescens TaxID=2606906 RepID=A0A5D8QFZ0_9THEO|nr:PolC-type DNA polymerase III [Calorimonas adulescens]TZE83317.1 PolC-type DNA polymerase III [Calorimonas adulescens]
MGAESLTFELKERIHKVLIWPESKRIKILLKSNKIYSKEILNEYYSFFTNQFRNTNSLEIRVLYDLEDSDLNKIMPTYWDNIVFYVNKCYPALIGWLIFASWEIIKGNYLNIYIKDMMGYNILLEKHIGDFIEELIKEELDIDAIVNIFLSERPFENQIFDDEMKLINQLIASDDSSNNLDLVKTSNKMLVGKVINTSPKKICEISHDSGRATIAGKVLCIEERKLNSSKIMYKFDVTDYTDSISCKYYCSGKDCLTEIKTGEWLLIRGDIQFDRYENDIVMIVYDINKYEHSERTDNAEIKRVELHLHTQMSAMDAVSSAEDYIKKAKEWGHRAIAITDHGVVQSYPDAYNASAKYGIKILYGVEAYIVDDTGKVIPNADDTPLDSEFTVVDIETTGLSSNNDEIIEIGAVKVKNYEIVARFDIFVKPSKAIPVNITKLTGISNDMVKNAPSIKDAIKMFKDFSEDTPIVAHNANFDISFLKNAAQKHHVELSNIIIDTLTLTRILFPGLKNYKLDTLTKYLNVTLENHHRASDDAEATAHIFVKCLRTMMENSVKNLRDINNIYSAANDVNSLPMYHCTILVKNQEGIKDLYRLISEAHLNYFHRKPRIPKSLLYKYKNNILIGSACEAGEVFQAVQNKVEDNELERILQLYDFLEIMPIKNNIFLVEEKKVRDIDELKEINRTIYEIGKHHNKLVVATGDAHFVNPEDEVLRKIILTENGFERADNDSGLYFKTTEEMLDEFTYLGKDIAYEVVVENTNKIADMIEDGIKPIPDGTFPPVIEGAEQELIAKVYKKAVEVYGDPLPDIVKNRLEKELNSIINNGYAVLYIIAEKLVNQSLSDGYLVGSRGSVGSSLVATFSGITEVNPLPPHYICPECKYVEFPNYADIDTGVDLPDKDCPSCGHKLNKNGFDIPFEVFLGFNGEKEPDIDLNFSGEYQPKAHKYTERLFGKGHVFRAGTIGTMAEKTAYGYIRGYMDKKNITLRNAEIKRLVSGLTGIKRTTGQHPGGVMIVPNDKEIYEFTPIQHPADDKNSDIITTHFDYHSISGRLLKLDILGHDDPTMLRMLQDLTGVDPKTIPLDDKETMAIFSDIKALGLNGADFDTTVGTIALPEFGTKFVRQMLEETKPKTFAELVRISGLSHGTDVWLNNAQDIIKSGKATLKEVICTRDDIMLYLIKAGVEPLVAFKIMENVRKGKGLSDSDVETMKAHNIPDWFIESCKKIKYMFPKAHACAYVIMAFRIAYYKVHYPKEFYATYFTIRGDDFDADIALSSEEHIIEKMNELSKIGNKATAKEKGFYTVLEVILEMYKRGIRFLPVDLYESDATKFIIKDEGILLPFNSIPGIGITASQNIIKARNDGKFLSIEDFRIRTKVSKTVIELLDRHEIFKDLQKTNQLSLFGGL